MLCKVQVVGVTGQIFAHVFEHIGMNIGLTPITGIPLPLVSYGGTFLLINMCLFGLVQSVWVHRSVAIEEVKKPQRPTARTHQAPAYV